MHFISVFIHIGKNIGSIFYLNIIGNVQNFICRNNRFCTVLKRSRRKPSFFDFVKSRIFVNRIDFIQSGRSTKQPVQRNTAAIIIFGHIRFPSHVFVIYFILHSRGNRTFVTLHKLARVQIDKANRNLKVIRIPFRYADSQTETSVLIFIARKRGHTKRRTDIRTNLPFRRIIYSLEHLIRTKNLITVINIRRILRHRNTASISQTIREYQALILRFRCGITVEETVCNLPVEHGNCGHIIACEIYDYEIVQTVISIIRHIRRISLSCRRRNRVRTDIIGNTLR